MIKRFLIILILIINLPNLSFADDIRDFQIEGMSIGDSLLDYMSEDEINNSKRDYLKNRKYYVVFITNSLKDYDVIDVYLKSGDKSYEIKTLSGILGDMNKSQCLSKKKDIVKELDEIFPNIKKIFFNDIPHAFDKTNKSKLYQTGYLFGKDENENHIRVECSFWTKKMKKKHKFEDTLNIVAMTTEIQSWIITDYK